jgi:hypothetical protein
VGIRTAETFVAWVDDISASATTGRAAPTSDWFLPDAADKNRLGHITRDGPPVMRKLICEATWTAIKKCPAFKQFFERVMGGKSERRKIAVVATMHRMIRVMGAMLRSGEPYDANYKDKTPLRGEL